MDIADTFSVSAMLQWFVVRGDGGVGSDRVTALEAKSKPRGVNSEVHVDLNKFIVHNFYIEFQSSPFIQEL